MYIFTDGACTSNGRKNSKASYAAYFVDTDDITNILNKKKFVIRGLVLSSTYAYNAEKNELHTIGPITTPSNNRGELLAIIATLIYLNEIKETKASKGSKASSVIIYSDSLISVRTINEWYNTRLKKGTEHEFKNFDLIKIMMDLLAEVRSVMNVEVRHVRGHQKITSKISIEQKNIISGNIIADKYCTDLLSLNKQESYEYISLEP
jgi:ribonuclease HI